MKPLFITWPYGSHVYGTNNETSDEDVIIVSDKYNTLEVEGLFPEYDVTHYTYKEFQKQLNAHEISVLEAFFLPQLYANPAPFTFKLDATKMRSSAAAKASNSWVKAKKKLEVEDEKYHYIGRKSAWHALRILDFACQIIEYGFIRDYTSCNQFYEDILSCKSWEEIDVKYRIVYNQLRSKLRILAPKG